MHGREGRMAAPGKSRQQSVLLEALQTRGEVSPRFSMLDSARRVEGLFFCFFPTFLRADLGSATVLVTSQSNPRRGLLSRDVRLFRDLCLVTPR